MIVHDKVITGVVESFVTAEDALVGGYQDVVSDDFKKETAETLGGILRSMIGKRVTITIDECMPLE